MYCMQTDTPTKVQSCNLNEELGQIDYIFSDKTGTLTCNIMEFRKLSAGFKSYGTSERLTDEEKRAQQLCNGDTLIPNVNFQTDELASDLRGGQNNNSQYIHNLLLNLALNHSIMVGADGYSASSPDELALVNAAKYLGYEFVSRNPLCKDFNNLKNFLSVLINIRIIFYSTKFI